MSFVFRFIKKIISVFGINSARLNERVSMISLQLASSENDCGKLINELRSIVPDISHQEPGDEISFNKYWELKRRMLQVFQCRMMLKALETIPGGKKTVVDIGDSAGTHMLYLKSLTAGKYDIDTMSVNLDPRAIKRIKSRGLNAIMCRAEELNLGDKVIDIFTSFEMIEHLHNPSIFFRRLAKKSACTTMVITAPYLKKSRVGLYYVRKKPSKTHFAGDEHIFELNPEDWTLLLLHSGWKVTFSEIYYQYPKNIPIINIVYSQYWKKTDFEGFWGAILEKDTSCSDLYLDWED